MQNIISVIVNTIWLMWANTRQPKSELEVNMLRELKELKSDKANIIRNFNKTLALYRRYIADTRDKA